MWPWLLGNGKHCRFWPSDWKYELILTWSNSADISQAELVPSKSQSPQSPTKHENIPSNFGKIFLKLYHFTKYFKQRKPLISSQWLPIHISTYPAYIWSPRPVLLLLILPLIIICPYIHTVEILVHVIFCTYMYIAKLQTVMNNWRNNQLQSSNALLYIFCLCCLQH